MAVAEITASRRVIVSAVRVVNRLERALHMVRLHLLVRQLRSDPLLNAELEAAEREAAEWGPSKHPAANDEAFDRYLAELEAAAK